jgi:thiosulfate/3-mercaptopyruvate sulfurtransferase
VNLPYSETLSTEQGLLPRARLRELFAACGASAGNVITMCGSGVTACQLLLALEVAGLGTGKLYAGSWSEWIRSAERPVATGRSPT